MERGVVTVLAATVELNEDTGDENVDDNERLEDEVEDEFIGVTFRGVSGNQGD